MRRAAFLFALLFAATPLAAVAQTAGYQPPQHTSGWPGLTTGDTDAEAKESFNLGPEFQRGRPAKEMLADQRRLSAALDALKPGRKGVVDAFVVSVALDSDPVFGREAREAGKVLTRRYSATGHSVTLAGTDGSAPTSLPNGSLTALTLTLARFAELMGPEDVLVLYSTSHGAKVGIVYHDGDEGFGVLTPTRLAALLDELGIKRRLLLLSACYSGVFVPSVASADTAVLTAASSDRPSFGCMAENDWTFFGDAMLNHALRKPQGFAAAAEEAKTMITGWESGNGLNPSNPQLSIGADVAGWLGPLEAKLPAETQPVGKPATAALEKPEP